MLHKLFEDAVADFQKAISLDPKKENKWANRARVMLMQIEQIKKKIEEVEKIKTKAKEKTKEKGKKK